MTFFLKAINTHKRDKNISFEEKTHTYTIRTKRKKRDTSFTSVTTWVHSLFPRFNPDKVIENMMKSAKWSENKYFGKTAEEIKSLWKENGTQAAIAGTKMHNDIERYYNHETVKDPDSTEFKYFLDFEKDRTKNPKNDMMLPYRTEWTVYDEELRLSGSIDMIYEYKDSGILVIYDWKRSKDIKKTNTWEHANVKEIEHLPNTNYWHYALQLNTYREILERNYDKQVKELWLVCLHPNKVGYEKIHVPILKEEMENLFRIRKESFMQMQSDNKNNIYIEDGLS